MPGLCASHARTARLREKLAEEEIYRAKRGDSMKCCSSVGRDFKGKLEDGGRRDSERNVHRWFWV